MLSLAKHVPACKKSNRRNKKRSCFSIRKHLLIKNISDKTVPISASKDFIKYRDTFIDRIRDTIQYSKIFDEQMHKKILDIFHRLLFSCGNDDPVEDSDTFECSSDSGQSSVSTISSIASPARRASHENDEGSEPDAAAIESRDQSNDKDVYDHVNLVDGQVQPEYQPVGPPDNAEIVANQPLNMEPVGRTTDDYAVFKQGEEFQVNFAHHVRRFLEAKLILLNERLGYLYAGELALASKMDSDYVEESNLTSMVEYLKKSPTYQ